LEIIAGLEKLQLYKNCSQLIYTFEELKWHACHFILSKWQSFTDLYEALRADSNLQWSKE